MKKSKCRYRIVPQKGVEALLKDIGAQCWKKEKLTYIGWYCFKGISTSIDRLEVCNQCRLPEKKRHKCDPTKECDKWGETYIMEMAK